GAPEPRDALTPRQRDILQLSAEGHSSKEIAQRLGLSPRTVDAHRAQLMERLDLHDLAGLVRFAVRVGLVTPEGEEELRSRSGRARARQAGAAAAHRGAGAPTRHAT